MAFPRGAWERSPAESPAARWEAGPAGRAVRGRAGFRGSKQPFGAEPVGGVRNREKGASCLSAASSCPAGSAARRPGSSQRQGCPFFWFFSLGRQRKERRPARGRCHLSDAGASGQRSHAGAWERSYPAISAITSHARDPSPCVRQGLRQVRDAGQEDSIGRIVGIAGENIFRPVPAIQAILHQLFIGPDPVRFPCFLQCSR